MIISRSDPLSHGSPSIRILSTVILAVIAGALGALIFSASMLWFALIALGCIVVTGAFLHRDQEQYWFGLFVFGLLTDLRKQFGDKAAILIDESTIGKPAGAIAGLTIEIYDLALVILLLFWFIRIVRKQQSLIFPKGSIWAMLFVLWSMLSIVYAPLTDYALYQEVRYMKYFLLYLYVANNLTSKVKIMSLVHVLLICLAVQAVITGVRYQYQSTGNLTGSLFVQTEFGKGDKTLRNLDDTKVATGSDSKRAQGTYPSAPSTGHSLMFLIPFALASVFLKKDKSRLITGLVLIAGLYALVVTNSRGSMLGFIVSLALVVWMARKRNDVSLRFVLYCGVATFVLVLVATPFIYEFFTTRVAGALYRLEQYRVGLIMLSDHPFLGVGLNNSTAVKLDYLTNKADILDWFYPIHSQHMVILVETGIVGYLFFFMFFMTTILRGIRLNLNVGRDVAVVTMGICGSLVATAVISLTDFLPNDWEHVYLWLYAGVIAAIARSPELQGSGEPVRAKAYRESESISRNGSERPRLFVNFEKE